MRKKLTYGILLFVMTVLTGCEDMFVHEIDFEGETEPEMLVITGNLLVDDVPSVYLSHSFFFDRNDKREKDWVTDANVSMTVNGTYYRLSYHPSGGFYYYRPLCQLHALDTVEIMAVHPKYETARARLIMPAKVSCSVSSYELQSNGTMAFMLNLDSYPGDAQDMIAIRASGEYKASWQYSYGSTQRVDTTPVYLNTVYSNDIVFAEAANPSVEGYFGAYRENYLYFPASELQQPRQIRLILDSYQLRGNRYDTIEPRNMEIEVMACSYGAYRFEQSTRSTYELKYMPTPSWLPEQEENFMEEIMDAIKETLGDQEPVQVYTNVEGGLGHVAAFFTHVFTIDF